MKLFINDWNGNNDTFVKNTEENREYPIDTWITTVENKQVYLVSAYVYDKFVMFFYMYDLSYHPEHKDQQFFKMPDTQREAIEVSNNYKRHFNICFDYEVNHLKAGPGSGSGCLPRRPWEIRPEVEIPQDELAQMHYSEYDYLYSLMKETNRIPKALRDKELAFRKDCYSFEEPVTEINYLALYPSKNKFSEHYVGSVFKVPYGKCDIKVPYTTSDTGEESFIIIKELKFYNMLESFEENYEKLKKVREEALQDHEKNKDNYGENSNIIGLDEMRQFYDQTILSISLLKPEERRSFSFYTNDYLDSKIPRNSGNSFSSGAIFFAHDEDDKMEGGLYKWMSSLGKACGEPKNEYEITLMSVTDSFEIQRKALFDWKSV